MKKIFFIAMILISVISYSQDYLKDEVKLLTVLAANNSDKLYLKFSRPIEPDSQFKIVGDDYLEFSDSTIKVISTKYIAGLDGKEPARLMVSLSKTLSVADLYEVKISSIKYLGEGNNIKTLNLNRNITDIVLDAVEVNYLQFRKTADSTALFTLNDVKSRASPAYFIDLLLNMTVDSYLANTPVELYYSRRDPSYENENQLMLPEKIPNSDLVKKAYPDFIHVLDFSSEDQKTFEFNLKDPPSVGFDSINIVLKVNDVFQGYTETKGDPSTYRLWGFVSTEEKGQKNNVSVFNNLINPYKGDLAKIEFFLQEDSRIEISIYSLDGKLVRVLTDSNYSSGKNSIDWDGVKEDGFLMAKGIYIIRVRSKSGPYIDEYRKVFISYD